MAKNTDSAEEAPKGWVSRFGHAPALPPDWSWQEAQRADDDYQIELLAKGLLMVKDQRSGGVVVAKNYYAISRTTLAIQETEVLVGCAPGHALVGGFVTLQEALLEFPQPETGESTLETLSLVA